MPVPVPVPARPLTFDALRALAPWLGLLTTSIAALGADRPRHVATPKWVATECRPIAVRDVLHDLVECLDTPGAGQRESLAARDPAQMS